MKNIRIKRLNEVELGDTSGDLERIVAKLDAANITGEGGIISGISSPDEFRDLMRHIADASGFPNDELGVHMMSVAQEFQKGQHTPGTDGVNETVKVSVKELRSIVQEEIDRLDEEPDSSNGAVLRVIDASENKVEALKAAIDATNKGEAESLYFDEENDDVYLFATRNDMIKWELEKKHAAKKATQPEQKPYEQMSDEELLKKVLQGYMAPRMGTPGKDVFMPAGKDGEVPSPSEEIKYIMQKWKTLKSIPGATIKIRRYPADYKPTHRYDRGRPNMIWGDVDYPSLD